MEYQKRVVEAQLSDYLSGLPAVAVDGPKAVGKTATASRFASQIIELDDPDQLALLDADRQRLTQLRRPALIDEWQRLPSVWDTVRRAVDRDNEPGQFILAGSASPAGEALHSGAGRIVRLRMRPMSFAERQVAEPTVSLAALIAGDKPEVRGESAFSLADYADEIVRSGFPAIRRLAERFRPSALDGYLTALVDHDFSEAGYTVRRPAALRVWLTAYAAASSTTTSFEAIARAATPGDNVKPSKATAADYRKILTRLWILDQVPGWIPTRNRLNLVGQAPKHQLADPALATRLLSVTSEALIDRADLGPAELRDGPLLGALFESLVTLSVRVYAQHSGASVSHLRTHRGDREVDLIVERSDGRVVALEVKLSPTVTDADVKHLHWLRGQIGDDLLDAAVITTGSAAYRRADGIAVIPLGLLGP